MTEQTLTEVNGRRSAFTRLERPLVIWLPEYAIRYLARNAPDFFNWNSGLYRFQTPEDRRPELLNESLRQLHDFGATDSLSVTKKRETEAYLKSLLDEYSDATEFDQTTRSGLLLRLANLYISRNSYTQAETCARQSLDVAKRLKDRGDMASSIYTSATINLKKGNHDQAREEFEDALQIQKQIGDRSGEAVTWGQLGILAADKLGRLQEGLRLLIISYQMFAAMGAAQVEQVELWVNGIASELDYDQETFDEEKEAALAAYQKDGGWSLLRDAFPEADFPNDVPSSNDETNTNSPDTP